MAGFLYFVETEETSLGPERIDQLGLAHALGESHAYCRATPPGMGSGLVLADGRRHTTEAEDGGRAPRMIRFEQAAQEWRPIGAAGGARRWLGWWKDAPPTPDELATRERWLPSGYFWEDAAGRKWTAPQISAPNYETGAATCKLPALVGVNEAGEFGAVAMDARCQSLWDETASLWEALQGADDIDPAIAFRAAVRILSEHYAIGVHEATALRMFRSEGATSAAYLVALAVGWIDFVRWREAKRSDPTQSQPATPG